MKLPAAYRTGTNVSGDLGRDTGPTFAEAKLIEGPKGFLGTGIMSKDFGVMADAAEHITKVQGVRQKQQADISVAEAKEPLARWGNMERIPTAELPEDVLTTAQLTQEYVLSSEVMPALYKKFYAETIPQAAEGIVTPGFRADWVAGKEEYAANDINRVIAQSTSDYERQVLDAQNDDYKRLLKEEKFGLAIGVIDGMNISDEKKQLLVHGVKGSQERAYISNIASSGNMALIDETINHLEEKGCSQYMSTEHCGVAINTLKGAFDREDAHRQQMIAKEREIDYFYNQEGVADGTLSESDVMYGLNKYETNPDEPGGITHGQARRLLNGIRSRDSGALQLSQQLEVVNSVMAGDAIADPTDEGFKKAVNAYVQQNRISDPAELENVMSTTGVMPKVVSRSLNAQALQGNAEQVAQAVELYSRLESSAPHLKKDVDNQADQVLSYISGMVQSGADINEATKVARGALEVTPIQTAARKSSYSKYRSENKGQNNSESLKSLMDDDDELFNQDIIGWGSDVNAVPEMQAEYDNNVEARFMYHGNMGLAQQQAYSDTRRAWSISETGNTLLGGTLSSKKRAMKYTPERVLNADADELQPLLTMFAKVNGVNPDHLVLHSDETTASGEPSWVVTTYNPDTGEFGMPRNKNNPLLEMRWNPTKALQKARTSAYYLEKQKGKLDREYSEMLQDYERKKGVSDDWIKRHRRKN